MSDIFICYSRTDSTTATRLAERLRAEGWTVFMDVQTHVGARYDVVIERELEAARAVVALWSEASRKSHDVRDEARIGRDKNILFPAFIERVQLPLGFGHTQTADLAGWVGEQDHPGLAQLLESLRLHLDSQQAGIAPAREPAPVTQAPKPGDTFRDKLKGGGDGPLMVVIPAGRFLMGSPPDEPERHEDEGPQHEVCIAKPFALGVYAVTFDDYDRFVRDSRRERPGDSGWGRGTRPVINVSWDDTQAYCAWLTAQTGRSYRLPGEAEWEYACRAGTATPFCTGEHLTTDQANFNGNYTYNGSANGECRVQTMPVGSFAPNAFGLYDMHGNVCEWCQDCWQETYTGALVDGVAWEVGNEVYRVLRGGSWQNSPNICRSAARINFTPGSRGLDTGFRVCCSPTIE